MTYRNGTIRLCVGLWILATMNTAGAQPRSIPTWPQVGYGDDVPCDDCEYDDSQPPQSRGEPGPSVNLALGKSYTWTHAPNYSVTTDATDVTALTDGVSYTGTTKLWSRVETVGWYYEAVIGVTLDLGEVYPIDSVTYHTCGGASGAYAPASLTVFVSDDGISWHPVTNLMTEAVSQVVYFQHKYQKSGLQTRGRYVALYAVGTGSLVFSDEIEVLSGDKDPDTVEFDSAPVATADLTATAQERLAMDVEMTVSVYLLGSAETAINAVGGPEVAGTQAILDDIESQVLSSRVRTSVPREQGLPYTPYDAETCEAVGAFMESSSQTPMNIWQYHRTDRPMLPFDRPVAGEDVVTLAAHMMRNEHEHASFALSNNTSNTMTIALTAVGSAGAPEVIFHQAVYAIGYGYQFIGDALPQVEDHLLELPAGLSTEIWVELDSAVATQGTYSVTLYVGCDAGIIDTLPMTVTVYAPVMPDNPEYLTSLYSYMGDDFVGQYPDKVVEDLDAYYVNVQTVNSFEIPDAYVYNGVPVLPGEADFANMDWTISVRPDTRFWILLVGDLESTLSDLVLAGDQVSEDTFKAWVEIVRDYMTSRGIGTEEWAFLFSDEVTVDQWNTLTKVLAGWTKETDPAVQVYQNWNNVDVENLILAEGADLIDIYSPTYNRIASNPGVLLDLVDNHPASGKYDSTSSLVRNPYTDYRMSHWYAWNWGLTFNGKWTYYDGDVDIWNDYGTSMYNMVYPAEDGPIPSKRLEAWRDGIEDYELLRVLQQAVDDTGDVYLTGLLTGTPTAVLANTYDTSILGPLRIEILQALTP